MSTVAVVVVDKTAVTTAEQRWVDLVTAKGDTPRLHVGADGAAIVAGAALVIVTGDANEGGTTTRDSSVPVIVANFSRATAMALASTVATPPTNASWAPSSGASGSPFLAGLSGATGVWSSAQAHRITDTPAPGAQRIWDLGGNSVRCCALYVPAGGTLTNGSPAAGPRYAISLLGSAMTSGYTATTGALMSAAYDQLLADGSGVEPLQVVVNDTAVAGGDAYSLSAVVTGGTAPYTYAWTPPAAAVAPTALTAQTARAVMPPAGGSHGWTVLVTDQDDATDSDTATVTGSPRQLYALEPSTLPAGWSTSTGSTDPTTVLDDAVDGPGLTPGDYVTVPGGTQTITIGVEVPSTAATSGWDVYLDVRLPATVASGTVTVELLDGTTVVGTETPTLALTDTGLQRLKASFTPSECAAITNPANAAVRLTTVLPA